MTRLILPLAVLALAACSDRSGTDGTEDDFAARVGAGNATTSAVETAAPVVSKAVKGPPPPGADVFKLEKLGDISGVNLGPRAGGCTFSSAGTEMLIAAGPADDDQLRVVVGHADRTGCTRQRAAVDGGPADDFEERAPGRDKPTALDVALAAYLGAKHQIRCQPGRRDLRQYTGLAQALHLLKVAVDRCLDGGLAIIQVVAWADAGDVIAASHQRHPCKIEPPGRAAIGLAEMIAGRTVLLTTLYNAFFSAASRLGVTPPNSAGAIATASEAANAPW